MKVPYRLGDSFALPLGNGEFARSCILHCEHRIVVVRILLRQESWLDVRVSDDALVLYRWRRDGRVDVGRAPEAKPENRYWMHAARAERLAAAALGAPHPRERKMKVREIGDRNAAIGLAELDDDCVVTITERVSNETLERVSAAIFNHPGVTIRLAGPAASQLGVVSKAPITRLSLAGPVDRLPPLEMLRHLDLTHVHQLASLAAAFPNLESLRISQRGAAVPVRDLSTLRSLRSLDLSLIHVSDAGEFAELTQLRALRLNRITGLKSADSLAMLDLRALALEHLHELERLDGLARIVPLEQLQLVGLWQFEIADVQWALDCEHLVRAEIDIGGRRKNVELYRRASWAYPWVHAMA